MTIQSPWQGSILAPKATIDGTGVNIDGSIMADKFLGAGETHRWDWHGCFHSEEFGSVLLTKTDAKDKTKVLAGAVFNLYSSDGKLIKAGLTTDENGQLTYGNLPVGSYYFVETKAPAGYQLDESKHHFEIEAGETAKAVGVTVTNEADEEKEPNRPNQNPKTGMKSESSLLVVRALLSIMALATIWIQNRNND